MPVLLQRDYRTAGVELLNDFSQDSGIKLQTYRAPPMGIHPPTAFVEEMGDDLTDFLSPDIFQHVITVTLTVLHGTFDHGDTVDQRDRFVDGFLDWVRTRYHAAGGNTLLRVRSLRDNRNYVPDWLPEDRRLSYFATTISLEGEATD